MPWRMVTKRGGGGVPHREFGFGSVRGPVRRGGGEEEEGGGGGSGGEMRKKMVWTGDEGGR